MSNSHGASVDLIDIRKSYGGNEVLRDVSINVPAGSFTTFLGPSGSGKTTTLAITTGLVQPDGGTVYIDGADCTRLAVNKRNLGFVFQSYALFPHMTIEKNIGFPLKLRNVPRAEIRSRVREALHMVHLDGYEKRFPAQLSGGQQQRVALARAVVFRPKVLLMDEPLGALDAGLRAHLQREIVRIGRDLGVTILYVTHDQDEALSMSDQIVLFSNGRIDQIGSPIDIYTSPTSVFAAGFIGSGTLIHGTYRSRAEAVVTSSGLHVPVSATSAAALGIVDGAAAAAVLRPESVRLGDPTSTGPNGSGTNGSGTIPLDKGTVTDIIYNGSRVRLHVALESGDDVECHVDAIEGRPYSLGDRVETAIATSNLPAVVPGTPTDLPPEPVSELEPDTGNPLAVDA